MTDAPQKRKTILLAAGGTGGHLFPAQALAQELAEQGCRVVLVTDSRGAGWRTNDDRIETRRIASATPGAGIFSKIKAAAKIALGTLQGLYLMARLRPDAVVGFGGYPSFPTVLAAQLTGRPTLLHEQNAVLGKANRLLARRADKIALSLPSTQGVDAARAIVTGNPVRADIRALAGQAYPDPASPHPLKIFVMGGSQGARVLSQVIPAALASLPADIKGRLDVVQQCRTEDIAQAQESYARAGIRAELKSFFNDVSAQLAGCHLFIGRSGASTVSEIAMAGRPAIFVPYPGHADQQQKVNAQALEKAGAAWIMTEDALKPETLAARIESLVKDPAALTAAAVSARACARPDAAANLARAAIELATPKKKQPARKHEAPAL